MRDRCTWKPSEGEDAAGAAVRAAVANATPVDLSMARACSRQGWMGGDDVAGERALSSRTTLDAQQDRREGERCGTPQREVRTCR